MRKTLVLLALLAFAAFPAFAQHQRGNGGGRGNSGESRGGHEQHSAPPRHIDRPRNDGGGNRRIERDDRTWRGSKDRDFHESEGWGHDRRGYHYGEPKRELRKHWDGRRFDHEYWEEHWGENHRFYWNHCGWYGPRYRRGSYFWYGGVYFVIVDEIPAPWYDDPVYVVYDDFCGCYYVVDPFYPGVRIHVDIRF